MFFTALFLKAEAAKHSLLAWISPKSDSQPKQQPIFCVTNFFTEVANLLWFLKYFPQRLGPIRRQFLFLLMKLLPFSPKFSMLPYIDGLRLPSNPGCLIEQVVQTVGIICKFHWQGHCVGFQVACKILKSLDCEPCWNLRLKLSLNYDSSCQVFSVTL